MGAAGDETVVDEAAERAVSAEPDVEPVRGAAREQALLQAGSDEFPGPAA